MNGVKLEETPLLLLHVKYGDIKQLRLVITLIPYRSLVDDAEMTPRASQVFARNAVRRRLVRSRAEHWHLRADVGACGSVDGGRAGDQVRLRASRADWHNHRTGVPEHGAPPAFPPPVQPSMAACLRHTSARLNRPLCTTSAPSILLAHPTSTYSPFT